MSSKGARQANPIGIDLSGHGLRAVQVETLEGGLRLVDAASSHCPVESDEDLRAGVEKLLRDHHFTGRRIATALPSDDLAIHHVRLPVMPDDALDHAIVAEIAERLPYDPAAAVVRHLEIFATEGRDSQADHVVFCTPRSVVEQHLRMAEKLGLSVVGVSALPLAIGHAFDYLGQRREETGFTFLVVHLEPRITHLVILHEGNLRFARMIPQGVHNILEAAAKATRRNFDSLRDEQELVMRRRADNALLSSRMLAAPDAPRNVSPLPYDQAGPVLDSYVDDILSCICYFASTMNPKGVDKAIFVGSQANDYGFCQLLANRLGLPAQIGDPFAGIATSPDLAAVALAGESAPRRPQPDMAVAVGLSLFGSMVN